MTLSTSIYAEPISMDTLTPEDVIWLDKALANDYHGIKAKDILDVFVKERVQLWRLKPGIAVTMKLPYPTGMELVITYAAGEDYIKQLNQFITEMEEYGKNEGCKWLSGMAQRTGLGKAYAKFGKQQGTLFVREIK